MTGDNHRLTSTQILPFDAFKTFFLDVLNLSGFQNDAYTGDGWLKQGFTAVNRN